MSVAPHTPSRPFSATAFLTGCGRSGTTILGKILSRHPDIAYVNDSFALWIEPFPFADVWGYSGGGADAEPRIALDQTDAARAGPEARRRFVTNLERFRAGKKVLVEKVAINNYRLGFLGALQPEARFINIVRNGVEVAHSIARRAAAGKWYGPDGGKWRALEAHARTQGLAPLLDLCTDDLARGLLEWRMSVEAAERFRAGRPEVPWLQLRYEELLIDPVGTARSLTDFLGLPPGPVMERFAATNVRRQNPPAHEGEVSPLTRLVAGPTLNRLGYTAPQESAA